MLKNIYISLLVTLLLSTLCPLLAEEVLVHTPQEFIDAIGSNKTIKLAAGTYEFVPELDSQSPQVTLTSVHDGAELLLTNIENLTILGSGEDRTYVTSPATYAEVLILRGVNNVTLKDITFGHSVQGSCQSGVLTIENSEKVHLDSLVLDGSGTTGLTLRNSNDITFVDSTISNCTDSIVDFSYARNVTVQNSVFSRNSGGFLLRGSSELLLRDSRISDNNGHFELLRLFDGTELDIANSRIENNQVPRLSNREELLKVSGGRIVNSGGFESKWCTTAPQILHVGSFHGDEVWARDGESWLGLFRTDAGWELKDTVVFVKRVHDPIVDSNAAQRSGKAVTIGRKGEPLFLVRGVNGLTEGLVQTLSEAVSDTCAGNNCGFALYPGMSKRYTIAKRHYTIQASGMGQLTEPMGEAEYQRMLLRDYRILISMREGSTVKKKELYFAPSIDDDAGAPGVLWAGDLDRDGALDLLLSTSTHYNVAAMTLYLSSFSESSLMPVKVAHFSSAGC